MLFKGDLHWLRDDTNIIKLYTSVMGWQ